MNRLVLCLAIVVLIKMTNGTVIGNCDFDTFVHTSLIMPGRASLSLKNCDFPKSSDQRFDFTRAIVFAEIDETQRVKVKFNWENLQLYRLNVEDSISSCLKFIGKRSRLIAQECLSDEVRYVPIVEINV